MIHIEDLPIDQFVEIIKNLESMHIEEKLDGANLYFGIDEAGDFFTSREGKRSNSERRYSANEWAAISSFNQFKAAHTALEQKIDIIKQHLQPGDTAEAEVLFGIQPNSVIYGADGKSFIAILRGVNGTTDDKADSLSKALLGQTVQAKVDIVNTSDGETISSANESYIFQFVVPEKIDSAVLKTQEVLQNLSELENFLSAKSIIDKFTNKELLLLSLSSIPKEDRVEAKQAKIKLLAIIQRDYKLPIKQALLTAVQKTLKSKLINKDMKDQDIGPEGVVLRNPQNGEQVKVVDKDVFLTLNKFNQFIRGQIQSGVNTVDPDSSVESRGGLMGLLRIRIAEVFGNTDLARGTAIRKALSSFKGDTPEETIKNFANSMKGINDFQAVRKKILAMISEATNELKTKLQEFKDNKENYRLKLKTGKEIQLSDETINKTLLIFAEARQTLIALFNKVKGTKSLGQLLAVLYGGHALTIHPKLNENLSASQHSEIDKIEYKNQDAFHLFNKYLSTVFMTMLIYHVDDTRGMRLLRDRKNHLMLKFDTDMSPFNFWGYAIWKASKPDMKKILLKKTQTDIVSATKHIPRNWIKQLHMDFSFDKKVKVDWTDHFKTLQKLIDFAGIRSDRLNSLLYNMVKWPELTYDAKVKTLNKLYFHAQQFVPRSSLFIRLRVIQNDLLLNATGLNDKMISESLLKNITKLIEDGEAGGAVTVATTAGDIAVLPSRLGTDLKIIRRKRNPELIKKLTMKFPDTRKNKS